jgi:hypothetical protein
MIVVEGLIKRRGDRTVVSDVSFRPTPWSRTGPSENGPAW